MVPKHYKPGDVELSFYIGSSGITIPGQLLGSVTAVHEEGEVETNTQAHTYREGNGKKNARVTAMIFLPNMGYLGKIFPSMHNAAVNPSDPGNLIGKAAQCAGKDIGRLHIHPVCEDNDKNDFHLFSAEPRMNAEPEWSEDRGALAVEISWEAHPDTSGNIYRWGTGDLTQDVLYNPATNTYDPVES